jgi:hypothetical protein
MVFLAKRQHTAPPFVTVNKRRVVVCETVHGGSSKAHVSVIDATAALAEPMAQAQAQAAAAAASIASSTSGADLTDSSAAAVAAAAIAGTTATSGIGAHVLWRFSHPSMGSARCAAMTHDARVTLILSHPSPLYFTIASY